MKKIKKSKKSRIHVFQFDIKGIDDKLRTDCLESVTLTSHDTLPLFETGTDKYYKVKTRIKRQSNVQIISFSYSAMSLMFFTAVIVAVLGVVTLACGLGSGT